MSVSLCAELRRGRDPANNPDGPDFVISGHEIERAAALPRVPLVVLAATGHQQAAITDSDVEAKIETLWRREEHKLAASVPHGTLTVVQSGHDIQELHPEAVIAALRSMLAVRPSWPPPQPVNQMYFDRPLSLLLAPFFAAGLVMDGIAEPTYPAGEATAILDWTGLPEIPPVLAVRLRRSNEPRRGDRAQPC